MKSKLLTVKFESTSPELSRQVTQRAVRLLEDFVMQKNRTRGGDRAEFAKLRLKEARLAATSAEDEYRVFLQTNRNYVGSSDPVIRLKGAALESELQLRRQLVTSLSLSYEQALLDEKNDVPVLNVLDAANKPIEKSGPARAFLVGIAMLLTFTILLAVRFRDWIFAQFAGD